MIVYRHRRLDTYEVFYVGIGKTEKRAYRKHSRNKHWHNIVNKAGYAVEIIATPDTWEEACDLEMLLISEYGRKDMGLGNLVNMTDGGDGSIGVKISEETRLKLSESRKGNKNSLGYKHLEETRKKVSKAGKGRIHSEYSKLKMSEAKKGIPCAEETKQKISETPKSRKVSLGSNNPQSKLTEQQVYEIKYCNFNSTQEEIAFIYGVTRHAVSDIRKNKTWKHI